MKKVELSSFAEKMLIMTLDQIPEDMANKLTVTNSSTGDEPYENFIQEYALGGKPLGVYMIGFIDGRIDGRMDWYAIDDFNVDHSDKWDEYEEAFWEWAKLKRNKQMIGIRGESGALFENIMDALDFLDYFERKKQVHIAVLDYGIGEVDMITATQGDIDDHGGVEGYLIEHCNYNTDEISWMSKDDPIKVNDLSTEDFG